MIASKEVIDIEGSNNKIGTKVISYNDETFTWRHLNGTHIQVLRRDSDGFINVPKSLQLLCALEGIKKRKLFNDLTRTDNWQKFCKTYAERHYGDGVEEIYGNSRRRSAEEDDGTGGVGTNSRRPIYDLPNNYPNELRSTHADSGLIYYIAIWCSPSYACLVVDLLKALDEMTDLTGITLQQQVEALQAKNEKLNMRRRYVPLNSTRKY